MAIYDHVVEVLSPGCLPNTLTIEEIYSGRSEIRNKVLARVFKELDYIEKWGSGLKRINELCKEAGVEEPVVKESGDFVSVTFKRNHQPTSADISRHQPIIDNNNNLTEYEIKILDYLKLNPKTNKKEIMEILGLSDSRTKDILKAMVDKEIIEKVGKARSTYYVRKKGV